MQYGRQVPTFVRNMLDKNSILTIAAQDSSKTPVRIWLHRVTALFPHPTPIPIPRKVGFIWNPIKNTIRVMLNFSTCVSLSAKSFSHFRVHIFGPVHKDFPFYTFKMLYNRYSFHDSRRTAAHKIIHHHRHATLFLVPLFLLLTLY